MTLRRIWFHEGKARRKASVIDNNARKGKVRVHIDGESKTILVAKNCIMPMKHNGKRRYKARRAEVVPGKKVAGSRPERFRPPKVKVEAVVFTGRGRPGDYGWQLEEKQQLDPRFGRALHVYNENLHQQIDKTSIVPGGGNAIARPYRTMGRSIGIPTGWRGGFRGLDEKCTGPGFSCTAKEAIDVAIGEIVTQVCDNPERYDTLFYCTNAGDGEELIGNGIFDIEDGTRRYITHKIKEIPQSASLHAANLRRSRRA